MTTRPAELISPRTAREEGVVLRYGGGFPFQVAPRTGGLLCNLRNEGFPVGDFENGMDAVLFDDLSGISADEAVTVTRNDKYIDGRTGEPRIVIKHSASHAFVPHGAKRHDGSPHPHAGSGFGLYEACDFPMKGNGYYDKRDKINNMVRRIEVHQLAYDGRTFSVSRSDTFGPQAPLKAPGSDWALVWPGFSQGIPDGDDLLYAILGTTGDPGACSCTPARSGVSRWRCVNGRWQPVSFVPIIGRDAPMPEAFMEPNWMEPSLARDTDGSLLFTARGCFEALENILRIWRSTDGGQTWNLIIDIPECRSENHLTINQAADGTPYVASGKLGHWRDWLCIWPLNEARTALDEPITVRNAMEEFGPPPSDPRQRPPGQTWIVDHANAGTMQLGDGRWHNILSYRIMDRGEHAGAPPAPQTGLYVAEVFSAGPEIAVWRFD